MLSKFITLSFILSLLSTSWLSNRAFALTDDEKAAKAAWQAHLSDVQKQIDAVDEQNAQYDYYDYKLQKNQDDQNDADQQIAAATAGLKSLQDNHIPTTDVRYAHFQSVLSTQTARKAQLVSERAVYQQAQKSIGQPDPQALVKILSTLETTDKKSMNADLDALAKTGLASKNSSLETKLDKINYTSLEKNGLKDTKSFMASHFSKDDLSDYQNYRDSHASTPIVAPNTPPPPAPPAPAPNPAAAATAPAQPAPPAPPAPAHVAIEPPAPPAPPPPPIPEVSCDQVYVELAKLVQSDPSNSHILADMIRSTAIKMSVLAAKRTSNVSQQTLEGFAHQNSSQYTDEQSTTFQNELTTLYSHSSTDAATVTQKLQSVKSSNYFNKSIRFRNEDSSAFILYLSQHPEISPGFTQADAAAVWAQAQIFKEKNLQIGSLAGNNLNFSSQVYQITQGLSKIDPNHGTSAELDASIQAKIQKSVDAALSGTDGKTLLSAIKANNCLTQADNKTTCDGTHTTLGLTSIEDIKKKIAEMAIQQDMKGLQDYQLSNVTYKADGSFSVTVTGSPLAASASASSTAPNAPAAPNTPAAPGAVAQTVTPTTSSSSTTPNTPGPASVPPNTAVAQPYVHQHHSGNGTWAPPGITPSSDQANPPTTPPVQ